MGVHTGLTPCEVIHFCPDLTLAVCLVMSVLQSYEWEFTWYTLCRQSLKQNPFSYYRSQACLGWFRNFSLRN